MNGHGKAPATKPMPQSIPYPKNGTDADKIAYIKEIVKHSPTYWCWNGTWAEQQQPNVPAGTANLVELWELNGIHRHPSRNPFHPVVDDQRHIWDMLVRGPFSEIMHALRSGQAQPEPNATPIAQRTYQLRDPRILPPQFPARSNRNFNKSMDTPDWADEGNLIGYTCESDITWIREIPNYKNALVFYKPNTANVSLRSLPSVYYYKGHLTTDHKETGNIGWGPAKGAPVGKCLFFGNVLVDYIDYS